MTDKSKLRQIRENIPKVYDSGWYVGYDTGNAEGFSQGYVQGYDNGTAAATPKGEVELTENNKTYDVTKYASAKVNISGLEDLSTVLAEQEELVAELKGIIAQKAKLGDAKLPSVITGYPTNLVITATDIGYGSNTIRDYAFYYLGALTSVTIPNAKGNIGECAFSHCENLHTVAFENGRTQLLFSKHAFSYCKSLKVLAIPESVTSVRLREYCFNSSGLTKLDMSKANDISGNYIFANMESLEEFVWSDTVKTIPAYAFQKNTSMAWFDTKETTVISNGAFGGCGFAEMRLSEKVTSIVNSVFANNKNLVSAYLHDNLTSMGTGTFSGCSALETVNISKGLKTLPADTFTQCHALKHILIPSNITSIGSNAFYYCQSLEYVDLTDYGAEGTFPSLANKSAFQNCPSTFEIRVSSGRKAELSAMTNWSTYADNIVEV